MFAFLNPFAQNIDPEVTIYHNPNGKDSYKFIRTLGEGGFGEVVKVEHCTSKKLYALKHIRKLSEEKVDKSLEEARKLEQLNHPNIIKYIDSYFTRRDDGYHVYIITEYVEGDTIEDIIKTSKKPLDPITSMKICTQILQTLMYLHKKNIIHRDIKPANIMVKQDKDKIEVKVLDFGLAVCVDHFNGSIKTKAGTKKYIAPEVFNKIFGDVTNKVDIWALGIILFQLLTLDESFYKYEYGFCNYIHLYPNIIQNSISDIGFRNLLLKMLSVTADSRCSSVDLMNNDLIKGWRHIINPDNTHNNNDTKTTSYYSPFISTFDTLCPNNYIEASLMTINSVISSPHIRIRLVKSNIIQKLVKLIQLPNKNDKNKREILINAQDNTCFSNLDIPSLPSSIINENNESFVLFSIDDKAIHILNQYLEDNTTKYDTAKYIISANLTHILIEKYKQFHKGMDSIIGHMCSIPYVQRILINDYGIENITISLMNTHRQYSMNVFQKLHKLSLHSSCIIFINHLSNRFASSIVERLQELLCNQNNAHYLITNNSKTHWKNCFSKIPSEYITDAFISSLLRLVYPMDNILQNIYNQQWCTNSLGCFLKKQYLISPKNCCLSCYIKSNKDPNSNSVLDIGNCSTKQIDFKTQQAPCLSSKTNTQINIQDYSMTSLSTVYKRCTNTQVIYNINKSDDRETIPCLLTSFGYTIKECKDAIQAYFEVKIEQLPISYKGYVVTIGFSPPKQSCNIDHFLGFNDNECAYHNDGSVYIGNKFNKIGYGLPFGTGDIIGCGITGDRKVFFTVNGIFLGYIYSNNKIPYKVPNNFEIVSAACTLGYNAKISFQYSNFIYKQIINSEFLGQLNIYALEVLFDKNFFNQLCIAVKKDNQRKNLQVISILLKALESLNSSLYNITEKNHSFLCGIINEYCPPYYNTIFQHTDSIYQSTLYNPTNALYSMKILNPNNDIPKVYEPVEFGSESLIIQDIRSPLDEDEDQLLTSTIPAMNNDNILNTNNDNIILNNDSNNSKEDISIYNTKFPFTVFVYYNYMLEHTTLVGNITISSMKTNFAGLFGLAPSQIKIFIKSGKEETKSYILSNADIIDIIPKQGDEFPVFNLELKY